MLHMRLNVHPDTQHQQAGPKGSERASRKPAPLLTKREAQGERSQSDRQHNGTKRIKALTLLSPRAWLSIQVESGQQDEQADGHIDIKDPAPGQILGNDPANRRPGSYAQGYDHGIQAQCQSSFMGGKGTRYHRHVDRKDERSSKTLEKASKNEQQQGRGEA